MKKRSSTLALCGFVAAILFTGCSKPQETTPAAEPKPMHPTVSQLDLDGDFILFADTSTIEQSVMDSIDGILSKLVDSGEVDASEVAEVNAVVAKIKSGIDWSGLLSLDSFAVSTKNLDSGLTRTISVVGFSEDDGQKALWRVLSSEPKELKGIGFVPADAVYTANSTASLNELWKVLNEALSTYVPEDGQQTIAQQIAMVEMMIGAQLDELLGSLDHEILVSLQLSETKQCSIPVEGKMLTIPEPSLIMGLQTKDPMIGKLILAKLQEAGAPVAASEHGGYTLSTLNLPLPLPFPVQPTLVQTEDYVLIGSSLEAVTRALDSQANQDGLIATPLYKKLLADAPAKTSSVEFLSPRFMGAYMDVIKQVLGEDGEEVALVNTMLGSFREASSGGYSLKTPQGIISKTLANCGGIKITELFTKAYATSSAIVAPLTTGN